MVSNVLFITPGPIKWASSRLRAHWVAEGIEGADVIEYDGMFYPHRDNIVFVKIVNSELAQKYRDCGAKVIWDICDPVHWFSPTEAREMADNVDYITCSNPGLQADFYEWYGKPRPILIPDRMRLDRYPIQRIHKPTNHIRFIWCGVIQNRFSLLGAMANLDRLKANGVDFSLTIFDDKPGETWKAKFPIYHTGFEVDKENEVMASHDIALLPPYPGAWGRVKSNNKHLTAWACGLPVTDGENYAQLYELATRATVREISAQAGMDTLTKHYTIDKSVDQWKGLLEL